MQHLFDTTERIICKIDSVKLTFKSFYYCNLSSELDLRAEHDIISLFSDVDDVEFHLITKENINWYFTTTTRNVYINVSGRTLTVKVTSLIKVNV